MGSEDEIDEVRKMINRMLADAVHGKLHGDPDSFSGGFTGRVTPKDEESAPVRRYVVAVPPEPSLPPPEVNKADHLLFVTVDLGGTTPTSVRARVSGRLLFVHVTGRRPVQRIVELPEPVGQEVRWAVRDGVLEFALRRLPPPPPPPPPP